MFVTIPWHVYGERRLPLREGFHLENEMMEHLNIIM